MSVNYGGIACTRLNGYPIERIGSSYNSGSTVEDKLKCNYSDRWGVIKELCGYKGTNDYPLAYTGGGSEVIGLYVQNVEVSGIGRITGGTTYEQAIITVNYGRHSLTNDDGVKTRVTIEPASEFMTLDTGEKKDDYGNPIKNPYQLKWGDGTALKISEMPGKIIRMMDIVITRPRLLSIPDWVWSLPGYVNKKSIYISALKRQFPPETLLCGNPSLSRTLGVVSTFADRWSITIRLTFRETGWNLFPKARYETEDSGVSFEPIYSDNKICKIYELASFGKVFKY